MADQTLGRRNAAPVQSTPARPVPPALLPETQAREVVPPAPPAGKRRPAKWGSVKPLARPRSKQLGDGPALIDDADGALLPVDDRRLRVDAQRVVDRGQQVARA